MLEEKIEADLYKKAALFLKEEASGSVKDSTESEHNLPGVVQWGSVLPP